MTSLNLKILKRFYLLISLPRNSLFSSSPSHVPPTVTFNSMWKNKLITFTFKSCSSSKIFGKLGHHSLKLKTEALKPLLSSSSSPQQTLYQILLVFPRNYLFNLASIFHLQCSPVWIWTLSSKQVQHACLLFCYQKSFISPVHLGCSSQELFIWNKISFAHLASLHWSPILYKTKVTESLAWLNIF